MFSYEFVGRDMIIDTLITFDVRDKLGILDGVGAIFAQTELN